jgi:cyclic AMP-dependent transcription factor ATF-4
MMTQDLSMYGSQAFGGLEIHSPNQWIGDNKSSPIVDDGLDDLAGLKGGLFGDCDALLENSPLPLDLEFDSEWMEDWMNIDQKLLFDDMTALDDALAVEETHFEENGHQDQSGDVEHTSLIDDTISQLLQLKAMADPESNTSPPNVPTQTLTPQFEIVLSPVENIQSDLQLHSETLLSPSIQANLSPSSSPVTTETVFEYPVVSCPSPDPDTEVELLPFDGYTLLSDVMIGDNTTVTSVDESDNSCHLVEDGRFTLLSDCVIDNSTMTSSDDSDNSSRTEMMTPPPSSRKRRKATDSGPSNKRTRKSNPQRQSACHQVKKERKRDQNKTAATRYRLKKRSEADVLSKEESLLLERNTELKSSVDKLANEIGYLKGLMREILAAKRTKQ